MAKSNEWARSSLEAYILAQWPTFQTPWHVRLLIDKLQAVERGDVKRLMVFMPPRHSKSTSTSEFFPAWYLGRNPDKYIIATSYGQDLSTRFGRRVRDLVNSPTHTSIFPNCLMSDGSSSVTHFETTEKGIYHAVGRGGAITGHGAHVLLIDDPLKDDEEANSEVIRERLQDWYRSTAYTRLMPGGSVILVQTRWHQDDLAGWLLNPEKQEKIEDWHIVNMPAIAEVDEPPFRKAGEPLWPEAFGLEQLADIKRAVGGRAWASLYQQRPSAVEGAIVKRDWWQFYRWDPAAIIDPVRRQGCPPIIKIIQVWDTAFETDEENDYSACTTWMLSTNGAYLLDCFQDKLDFPDLNAYVEALAYKWNPNQILIEKKASGHSLIQSLRKNTRLPIKALKADRDKVSRVNAITPVIESGRVFIPQIMPWCYDFITHCAEFPNGVHDDIMDTVAHALAELFYANRTGRISTTHTGDINPFDL